MIFEYIDSARKRIAFDYLSMYYAIETFLKILSFRSHSVLHEHLKVKKVCFRRIPYNLSTAKIDARMKLSRKNLNKFTSSASKRMHDIVSYDETWSYSYDL